MGQYQFGLLGQDGILDHHLHGSAHILEGGKRQTTVTADAGQSTGHSNDLSRAGILLEVVVALVQLCCRCRPIEPDGIGIDPLVGQNVSLLAPPVGTQRIKGPSCLLPVIPGGGLVCHHHTVFLGFPRCKVPVRGAWPVILGRHSSPPPAIDIDLITGWLPVTVVIVAIGSAVLSVGWHTAIRPLPAPGHVPAHCEPPVRYRRRFRD